MAAAIRMLAKALMDAHRRGVRAEVILDKSQRTEKYSEADFLQHEGIPCATPSRLHLYKIDTEGDNFMAWQVGAYLEALVAVGLWSSAPTDLLG
jgi:hypothetical protein